MSTQSHKRLPLYATPPSTLLEGLRRVREIIETGHTKGWLAQDHYGREVDTFSPYATCASLIGACYRASFGDFVMYYAVFEAIAAQLPESFKASLSPASYLTPVRRLVWWNDAPERTQSEVLALIDKAIEVENRKQ